MKKIRYILLALICCAAGSCIKNDIPYPYQPLSIISVTGDGFTSSVNENNNTVTLNLEEQTDIRNVNITSVVCSDEAKLNREVEGTFDLTLPLLVTLYNYQYYDWQIVAQQTISRALAVTGQIGEAVFDADNCRAYLTISNAVDATNITISEMKLAPADIATYSPISEGDVVDLSGGLRTVNVTYHDRTETWYIYASFEEPTVNFTLCSVRATRAWVESSGDTSSGEECGYRYRKLGDTDWETVVVTSQNGYFSTEITGLTPNTAYEFQTYIGDLSSPVESYTTEDTPQLDNSGFETWDLWKEWNSKTEQWVDTWVIPYLFFTDDSPVWDTGNLGAYLGGATLTKSSTDARPGSEGSYSAQLTAQNVLVKFAAGNMFTGKFAGTYNTDGLIAFGTPFTQRPIALRGWYKYTCGIINKLDSDRLPASISSTITINETPDIGTIYVALGTWTPQSYSTPSDTYPANAENPKYVFTLDQSTFFDPTDDDVVAYGTIQKSESVSEWTQFEIPLEYYDKTTLPTHIMIVASTSLYGDYFTGSTSSEMWLDDFELVYE